MMGGIYSSLANSLRLKHAKFAMCPVFPCYCANTMTMGLRGGKGFLKLLGHNIIK